MTKSVKKVFLVVFSISTICLLVFFITPSFSTKIDNIGIKENQYNSLGSSFKKETIEERENTNYYLNVQENTIPYSISIEGIICYLKEIGHDVSKYNEIKIYEKYIGDEVFYFATMQQSFFWSTSLYLIKAEDGIVLDIVDTGAGGLDWLFEFDIIEISQGRYIAVYCSSHAGNGHLNLIPINNLGVVDYSFSAIDYNFEDTEQTAITYALSRGYGNDIKASAIFINGKLHADYVDINNDGNTDIVLKGVQQIYSEEDGNQILQKEYFIKDAFVFSSEHNEFFLDDELSKRVLLTND